MTLRTVRVTLSIEVDEHNWYMARFRGDAPPTLPELRQDVREAVAQIITDSDLAGRELAMTLNHVA